MVRPSIDKLRELILYISARYSKDERFTSTRLTKILFWSDFEYFRETGHAITGSNYVKKPHGPMLENHQAILQDMQTRGELTVVEEVYPSFVRRRPTPHRVANLEAFSSEELSLIDRLIQENYGKTASEVSDTSHQFIGWQLANLGDRIPYGTVWLSTSDVSPEDVQYAQELTEVFGLE